MLDRISFFVTSFLLRISMAISSAHGRVSIAIISVLRRALRRRDRVREPTEIPVTFKDILAVLNDPRKVGDNLRIPLIGFSDEEVANDIKLVKRLLDCTLMPMAWIMYFCNYLDRSAIASAKIMGLLIDLDMTSKEYGLAIMILFIAYLLGQVPSNLYLAGGRPSIYLPTAMVLWGGVCFATAFVKTAGGIYALRFSMGLLEAPFTVGCLHLITSWYPRTELGLRTAILLTAPMSANAFSGVISHGIAETLDGSQNLDGWRWLFIVCGSLTVFVASLAFFLLPDYPQNTRWLHVHERAIAQLRLIADRGASDRNVSKRAGFKKAIKTQQVWTFAAIYFLLAIGSSLHNFFPSVVNTLGFSPSTTLWMTAPPCLFSVVIAISTALSADRRKNASFHVIGATSMAMTGFLLFLFVQSDDQRAVWVRYLATFLMMAGAHAATPVALAWAQKTLQESREMRAVAIAIINASGTVSQIVTSELYPKHWEPRYIPSMSLNTACGLAAILLAIFMREKLRRTNKRLDQHQAFDTEIEKQDISNNARESQAPPKSFRYVT